MHKKALLFNDMDTAHKILQETNPKKIKQLGRKVKSFDAKIWNENAQDVVYRGLLLKFSQNEWMKTYLLSTSNKRLVEASPSDKIWGIGMSQKHALNTSEMDWPGTNWLGKCLERVRDSLIN